MALYLLGWCCYRGWCRLLGHGRIILEAVARLCPPAPETGGTLLRSRKHIEKIPLRGVVREQDRALAARVACGAHLVA